MRIYVSAIVQHSIFSSGHHTTSLQLAAALKDLGHDVFFLNVADNKATWWDDCSEVAADFPVLQKGDFYGPNASVDCIGGAIKADLLIDSIGSLSGEERTAIAGKTVLFVRQPPTQHEIESIVYATVSMRRCYDGISEIWSWDFYKPTDFTVLALLARCTVRSVPFVWSARFIDAYCRGANIVPWHMTSAQGSGWNCRVAETNNTNRSNCTIPLVVLRDFAERCPGRLAQIMVHNSIELSQRPYFKDNVLKHCAMKPDPVFIGRNRVVEWCMQPRSMLLAHCRFTPVRYLYLDAAWAGIPMIHNSPFMRQLGGHFDRYYYPNNEISAASKAMELLMDDYVAGRAPGAADLARTRGLLEQIFSAKRNDAWNVAIAGAIASATAPTLGPATYKGVAATYIAPSAQTTTFRVQFVGMWDKFQNDYNFFTLLLEAYFAAAKTSVKVIGCGAEYDGDDIALRVLGPFINGATPVRGGVPTVFTTSENIAPLQREIRDKNNIKLELGFSRLQDGKDGYMRLPLWMMSIDWFGADNERLVNPRVIPLEWLTRTETVSAKRPKFCSFVVSNPNNPVRNAALDLIGRVGHVDSAGRYRNNCGDAIFAGLGGGGGEVKKVEFMKNYRFAITYENGLGDGYVTEKLFHAKAAGCVPIYWGDESAATDDFQAGGWIKANGRSDEELVAEVRRLEADEEARLAIAAKPLLGSAQVAAVRRRLAAVAKAMVAAAGRDAPDVELLGNIKGLGEETVRDVSGPYGRKY
jgi:hypothetical protein